MLKHKIIMLILM